MSLVESVVCPICHEGDQTQKVRAIVSSGTSSSATNLLSRRLAPPDEPSRPPLPFEQSTWTRRAIFWISAVSLLGLWLTALPIYGLIRAANDKAHVVLTNTVMNGLLITIGTGVVLLASGMVAIVEQVRWMSKRRAAYLVAQALYPATLAEYQTEHQRWGAALARWSDDLSYCHRDDVVFLPGSRAVRPEEMQDVLLSHL